VEHGRATRSRMERLLERWRPYDARRLTPRELRVEAVAAAAFAVVAAAMIAALPAGRPFDPAVAAGLVGTLAIASRVRMYIGAGAAVPTQLALVPMLFLLPPAAVPACVACGLAGATAVAALRRRCHPDRVVASTADAWHAVGPSLVFAAAGAPSADLREWPLLAAALLAQCATDLVAATVREWVGRGIAPAIQARVVLTVYLIDACLTPAGLVVAVAAAADRFAFLLVLPLLGVMAAVAADRRVRIREAVGRVDELREQRAHLDRAVHRIGEALGSKLDAVPLSDLILRTAVEACGAEGGSARLGTGTIWHGAQDGDATRALEAAERVALRTGELELARIGEHVAMAQALTGGGRKVSTERLAVVRRGRPFGREEQALLGYLAQQASIALENVALHEQLRKQATVDDLTGLSNHRRFHEALALELVRSRRSGRPTALALIDVDSFKAINDTYGHRQGDTVLQEVAAVLGGACRATDEPARYGGDELAVILAETDL
jgi:GAF domain-containing protein